MRDEKGFTLIETILVLFIVVLTLQFPPLQVNRLKPILEEEWFFNELESRIQTMQVLAIVSGAPSTIMTMPSNRKFRFKNLSQLDTAPLNREMNLPDSISFMGTATQNFYFKGNTGNVSAPLTIRLLVHDIRRDLTVQLGSGRYLLSPKK